MTGPKANGEPADQDVVVACFKKNAREAICVGTNQWKGETRIFIRTFVSSLEGDDLIPTKKGISLPRDRYPQLLEGLKAVGDVAGERDVARIRKSERYEVRVSFNVYKGTPLVSVRTFVRVGNKDNWSPTPQGVSVRLELYPQLLEAVEKLGDLIG
jgi:hypothetical protein